MGKGKESGIEKLLKIENLHTKQRQKLINLLNSLLISAVIILTEPIASMPIRIVFSFVSYTILAIVLYKGTSTVLKKMEKRQ